MASRERAAESFFERAARNFLFSGAGTAANFLLGLLFAGLTIRYLGPARAGFFMALAALTGLNAYLGDFGLGTAAIRRVAALNAQRDLVRARRVVGSVCTASLASNLAVAVAIIVCFTPILHWTRLEAEFWTDARWAATFSLGSFVITQSLNAWKGTYTALERYDLASGLNAAFGLLNGLGGIAILSCQPTMTALAGVRLGLNLARLLADAFFNRRLLKRVPWPAWDWGEVRPLLSLSGWVYLDLTGSLLLGKANSLVLTTYLGSAGLPYYDVPQRIYSQVHTALASQAQFLFPAFASFGTGAADQIRQREDRLRWLLALGSGAIYMGLAMVGPDLLSRLVNPDFARHARLPLYLACIQGFFQAQNIVPYYSCYALGKGKPNSITGLVQGVLVAVTSMLLVPHLGFLGGSLAQLWVIATVIWQITWIDHLIRADFNLPAILKTYLSPFGMILIWLFSTVSLSSISPSRYMNYGYIFIGGLLGFIGMLLIEKVVFPDDRRWDVIRRLIALPLSRASQVVQSR